MSIDIKDDFLDIFNQEDIDKIWRREKSKRYQQFLEHQYIIFVGSNDIGRNIGRDSLNLHRQLTESMVEGKLYIKVSEFGATLIEFNRL